MASDEGSTAASDEGSTVDELDALARRQEARADALWKLASDFDRWGLRPDAAESRSRSRWMRIRALTNQARAVALSARHSDTAGSLF